MKTCRLSECHGCNLQNRDETDDIGTLSTPYNRKDDQLMDKLFGSSSTRYPVDHYGDVGIHKFSCLQPRYSEHHINNEIIRVFVKNLWLLTQILASIDILPYDILVYTFLHMVCSTSSF